MIKQYYKDNFDHHVKRIYARNKDIMAAEDVVQDAFERAMKFFHTFDQTKDFGGWFNTILNNAYKDAVKDKRMQGMVVEFDENLNEPVPLPDLKEESLLQKRLEKLPNTQRQICHLYFNCGLQPREIAQIVESSPRTCAKVVSLFKTQIRGVMS